MSKQHSIRDRRQDDLDLPCACLRTDFPDHSMFRDHSCPTCGGGTVYGQRKPCINGNPGTCGEPIARNH